MEKLDWKKELKHLYQPSTKEVTQVDVPAMNFLMVDGKGDPNTAQEYADAISALFSVAYTLKFMVKKGALAIDYGVMPLEGLWWADDMSKFGTEDKSNWLWTAMIAQPEFITQAMVDAAIAEVKKKEPGLPPQTALRDLHRRQLRAAHAHRPVQRGRPQHRKSASLH